MTMITCYHCLSLLEPRNNCLKPSLFLVLPSLALLDVHTKLILREAQLLVCAPRGTNEASAIHRTEALTSVVVAVLHAAKCR